MRERPADDLPVLKVFEYEKPLVPGARFTDRASLEKIRQTKNLLQNVLKLTIEAIHYYPVAREYHLITDQGTAIWFDFKLSVEDQLKKLDYASNEINLFTKPWEHIDLRIPHQIFWK